MFFPLRSWVGLFEFVSFPPCYALYVAVWCYYFEAIVGLFPPFLVSVELLSLISVGEISSIS